MYCPVAMSSFEECDVTDGDVVGGLRGAPDLTLGEMRFWRGGAAPECCETNGSPGVGDPKLILNGVWCNGPVCAFFALRRYVVISPCIFSS